MNKEEEKIKEIIQKAKKNGFKCSLYSYYDGENLIEINEFCIYNQLIFYIPFLKAYFKNSKGDCDCCGYPHHSDECLAVQDWQYHAQELVLAEDRIDYLYKFI